MNTFFKIEYCRDVFEVTTSEHIVHIPLLPLLFQTELSTYNKVSRIYRENLQSIYWKMTGHFSVISPLKLCTSEDLESNR